MNLPLLLAGSVAGMAAGPEPIVIYDLTPALRFDAREPAQVAAAWDHAHVVATLQGIVNRDAPRLYVRFVRNGNVLVDDYWLERMSAEGGWLHGRERRAAGSLADLIKTFRRDIRGVVLYDPAVAATSNLASTIAGVEDLVAVRYDPSPGSAYHALVATGPKLPVVRRLLREDGAPLFTGRGTIPDTDLPSTGSAKCDAHLWLKHHYLDTGKVDATYAGYYIDQYWRKHSRRADPNQHTLTNHDFFVARRGWFFDLSVWGDEPPVDDPDQPPGADLSTLKAMMLSAYEHGGRERMIHVGGFTPWAYKYTTACPGGGKHEPVPTEWETSRVISAYNAFVDADAIGFAAMANGSFWQHFPLKERYPQPWVTRADLIRRGYLNADGALNLDGREFMIYYVGDYDSTAWVYQFMHSVWDNPARGKLPLMWCISPMIERRAPMILDHLRRTATPNDYFAAADNGAGYLNPGMLQEPRAESGLPSGLDAWANHCLPMYRRWDITVTGFIIDGFAPGLNSAGLDAYARFSPNGIVPQKIPASLLHGDMPVMQADYDLGHDVNKTADLMLDRIAKRKLPFHWFRAILRGPEWYLAVTEEVRRRNPKVELLDGPTFFELYRIYLREHPDAAAGKIPRE